MDTLKPSDFDEAMDSPDTIERILRNEKHVGDLLMQKTYTVDFLTKTQTDNNGDLEQYFIKDDHPAIIPREEWEAVQIELDRRENFRQKHGIRTGGSNTDDRFYSRIFCGHCGGKFIRKNWKGNRAAFWKCENAEKKNSHTCNAENIREDILRQAVVIAWNSLVENREKLLQRWEQMATDGDALQRYRARMMIAITAEGLLDTEVPELTRSMLEEITVHSPTELTVSFLDGSERHIKI